MQSSKLYIPSVIKTKIVSEQIVYFCFKVDLFFKIEMCYMKLILCARV